MSFLMNTSVKQKLVLSSMGPAAVAVALVAFLLTGYLRTHERRQAVETLTAVATIVGDNTAAALAFSDRSDAEAVLSSLTATPSIVFAVIYDGDGEVFATFHRDANDLESTLQQAPGPGTQFVDGNLVVVRLIMIDARRVGTIHIVSDMGELTALLRRTAATAALLILIALAVAFVLSSHLHKLISVPISLLARTAQLVSEREDYSIRIESTGSDELGRLMIAFNSMLDEIERRDTLLREKEAYFRSLIEHSSDLITVVGIDGTIRYQSPSSEEVMGYEPEYVLGRSVLEPVHEEDREKIREAMARGFAEPGMIVSCIARFRHKEGSWRVLDSVFTTHAGKDGDAFAVIHARDITDRRRLEKEQERLGAQLQQAQKMEAVGQLTGGIAHDFNNLLTVIMGNLELMTLEADNPEELHSLIDEAIRAAHRAAALTHRLLAFSRKQPLNPRVVDLKKLIAGTTDLLSRTLGETIEVETLIGDDLWKCRADPAQLENVLLNLAINARDAMPGGGKLEIEVSNAYLDDHYAFRNPDVTAGACVMLAVTDTGIGMDPDVLSQVFDPFFTTKGVGEGSGLGLSMVYGFAKQSGGHVSIQSEEGVGTVVTVYLPSAEPESSTADRAHSAPAEFLGNGELILIVEDDHGVRRFAADVLDRLGYRTLEVEDAASALTTLEKSEEIALLFTDMVLPGEMNGAELGRAAERKRPGLKVLYTSGYPQDATMHKRGLDPCVELLQKPFTQRALARVVHCVMTGGSK